MPVCFAFASIHDSLMAWILVITFNYFVILFILAPNGQPSPNITSFNSSSIYLSWNQPSVLNGPLPVRYQYERSYASLHYPPPQVEAGTRFSSFGYYQLPSNIIADSAETDMEFEIKTRFSEGLIFYASSSLQEDMLAIELRSGKPWFIFDTETGPSAFTVANEIRINDGRWHRIKVTRQRRSGTITIDGIYTGAGSGSGTANIVGQISVIYIGGLPRNFRIIRTDSGNAILQRSFFIGCIKNMKYKNIGIDFTQAIQSANVEPLYSHCPADFTNGIHFKGGGYMALSKGLFTGSSIFVIQVHLRTTYRSGLILFAHGDSGTSIALALRDGNVTMFFRTPRLAGSESVNAPMLCDGRWHNLTITGFASSSTVVIDGVVTSFGRIPPDAVVNSTVYMGGVPQEAKFKTLLRTLVNQENLTFGGCMRDMAFSAVVNLQRDVIDSRNVAFDGCPADFVSGEATYACSDPFVSTHDTMQSRTKVDGGLRPFTGKFCAQSEHFFRVYSHLIPKVNIISENSLFYMLTSVVH